MHVTVYRTGKHVCVCIPVGKIEYTLQENFVYIKKVIVRYMKYVCVDNGTSAAKDLLQIGDHDKRVKWVEELRISQFRSLLLPPPTLMSPTSTARDGGTGEAAAT